MPLQYLGHGRHRIVFLSRSGKYVYKFPMNPKGVSSNVLEAHTYSKNKINLARCRLYKGILIMERVEPVAHRMGLPEWVKEVDCLQVGLNRKFQLVAYDYGLTT